MSSIDRYVPEDVQYDKPCDVCVAVDSDTRPKETRFCKACGANICIPHQGRYDLRLLAAMKKISAWILGGQREEEKP